METKTMKTFIGTISPAGWGSDEKVKKLSLYTGEGEDILLKHKDGIDELIPFINKFVKLSGVIISEDTEGRTVLVRKVDRKSPSKTRFSKIIKDESMYPAA